jgi:hypothetical protein
VFLAKSVESHEKKRVEFCANARKCKKAQKSAEPLDCERLVKRSLREEGEGRKKE